MSIGRMDPGARERLTVAALLVSVFMAGALTGAAALTVLGTTAVAGRAPSDLAAARPDFDRRGDGQRSRDGDRFRGDDRFRDGDRFPGGRPSGRGGMRVGLEWGLIERLDLSADQQERIDAILREQRAKAEEVLQEIQPRLTARLDSTNAQIRAVLTADQQKEFDSYIASGRGNIFRRMPWGPSPTRPQ
jgi:uncharacterized membrane protein